MNEFDIAVLSDALEKAMKMYDGIVLDKRTVAMVESNVQSIVRDAVEKGQFDPEAKVRVVKVGRNGLNIVLTPKFVEYSIPCTHPDLDTLMDNTDQDKIKILIRRQFGNNAHVILSKLKSMLSKLGNPPFSHLRIAILDSNDTVRMFLEARGRCCEIEEDLFDLNGETVAIGFNHGHSRKV